jgi:hypothetical protein
MLSYSKFLKCFGMFCSVSSGKGQSVYVNAYGGVTAETIIT